VKYYTEKWIWPWIAFSRSRKDNLEIFNGYRQFLLHTIVTYPENFPKHIIKHIFIRYFLSYDAYSTAGISITQNVPRGGCTVGFTPRVYVCECVRVRVRVFLCTPIKRCIFWTIANTKKFYLHYVFYSCSSFTSYSVDLTFPDTLYIAVSKRACSSSSRNCH